MSVPCFHCGVRTDVSCRHRLARAIPKPAKHFDGGHEVDGRIGIQFWAAAINRGVTRGQIMEALKAAL